MQKPSDKQSIEIYTRYDVLERHAWYNSAMLREFSKTKGTAQDSRAYRLGRDHAHLE